MNFVTKHTQLTPSSELPDFTDIYVHIKDPLNSSFFWPGPVPTHAKFHPFINSLISEAPTSETDFRFEFEGHRFRVNKMATAGGEYYLCRRLPSEPRRFEDCNIHKGIVENLLSERLCKGGLIVICGRPGNGKSTTCAGLITARLEAFGGLTITIEDPIEMPIHGNWGEGVCFQREVPYERFPSAIRETLRGYPASANTSMLIGEVRDPKTAALALQSAVDGRLVMVTVHAGNAIQGLLRMQTLASSEIGASEARHLLAATFRTSLYQEIRYSKLTTHCIFDTPSVAGKLVMGEGPEHYKNDLRLQMSAIKLGNEIELRPLK